MSMDEKKINKRLDIVLKVINFLSQKRNAVIKIIHGFDVPRHYELFEYHLDDETFYSFLYDALSSYNAVILLAIDISDEDDFDDYCEKEESKKHIVGEIAIVEYFNDSIGARVSVLSIPDEYRELAYRKLEKIIKHYANISLNRFEVLVKEVKSND